MTKTLIHWVPLLLIAGTLAILILTRIADPIALALLSIGSAAVYGVRWHNREQRTPHPPP